MSNRRKTKPNLALAEAGLCHRCGREFVPGQPRWKCCSKHTTANGLDMVCDNCAVRLHPEKAAIVRHRWFDADGILPCCGLSRYEVRQTDQITPNEADVTCTGKKRYTTAKEF